jgi:hypothetical protein
MSARRWLALAVATVMAGGCVGTSSRPHAVRSGASAVRQVEQEQLANAADIERLERRHLSGVTDRGVFRDAAVEAWAFAEGHYYPSSGLMGGVGGYPYVTVWDIGSTVAALFCARRLGLLDQPTYEARISRLFDTLNRLPLYDGAVFNKMYDARNGAMASGDSQASTRGFGWSATDIGRLLVWLKIVSVWDPAFAPGIENIVRRNDMTRLVKAGYLMGEDARDGNPHLYQESRIGYEQYAAQGFAAWGVSAARALDLDANALPLRVYGQPLVADFRGDDRLTSEPFFLMGLETGWDAATASLMRRLLQAQQTRYEKTGVVTLVSEDAIAQPPAYFYYYSVYANSLQFGIDVQDPRTVVDGPRWVSTKAAFALHALMPTWYTQLAIETVRPSRAAGGWGSGVYEGSGQTTGTANINTAAVVMTAAVYDRLGHPLLQRPAGGGD